LEIGPGIGNLAAAHAAAGQFDEAVHWQITALEDPECHAGADSRHRLELYKLGIPYQQSPEFNGVENVINFLGRNGNAGAKAIMEAMAPRRWATSTANKCALGPDRLGCKLKQAPKQARLAELDLHLRWDRFSGLLPMLIGGLMTAGVLYSFCIFSSSKGTKSVGEWLGYSVFAFLLAALGGSAFAGGLMMLFDRRAKLSITADGLSDHRTGAFVCWSDFRGVRLCVRTTNGALTSAMMYVKIPHESGEREIAFQVCDLERSYNEIADLVQKRGTAAAC
jgi:hypothetical protein